MLRISTAITAVLLSATVASSQSFFGSLEGAMDGDQRITLNLVRSDAPGFVQIERLNGDILGMARVQEGANSDVLVSLGGTGAMGDLVAKLIVNGEVADISRIQVTAN